MGARTGKTLYSPSLLALAASLADFPMDRDFAHRAQARSRTCGSTIDIGLNTAPDGAITQIGLMVTACAVGQGSSAILAGSAKGRSTRDLARAAEKLERWLTDEGDPPDWPGIEALLPARDYPGRHGALLLPWKAALDALCTASTNG
jgi:NifU-like protein involved in Fe-S cluster formation